MITSLGIFFLPLSLFFWRQPARLLELVFVGSVFAAAAVFVISGYGISPGLIPSTLFIGFFVLQFTFGLRLQASRTVLTHLLPFMLVVIGALLSSYFMPRLFQGAIFVWPQKASGIPVFTPLAPNSGNITQDLYLLSNALLTLTAALYMARPTFDLPRLLNIYFASGLLVVFISIWQFADNVAGVWFPTDFFLSNPGWALLSDETIGSFVRITGPFSEPAALAAYLCGSVCAAGLVVLHGSPDRLPRILLVAGTAVILLSTSTTGYAGLGLIFVSVGCYMFLVGTARLRKRLVIAAASIALLVPAATVTLTAAAPGAAHQAIVIIDATLNKQSTSSYNERMTSDRDSVNEMLQSDGLGVGWGSNRSSSLLPGLCASVGIWGLFGLSWFSLGVFLKARRALRLSPTTKLRQVMYGCAGGLIGTLIAAMLSVPSLTSPDFYLLLAMLIATVTRVHYEARTRIVSTPLSAHTTPHPQQEVS